MTRFTDSPDVGGVAFTRGPWEAAERGGYSDFDGDSRVILGDDMRIAVVQHHGSAEAEANTNLIAAAPDLFEAVRLFVEEYDGTNDDDGVAMMLAYEAALTAGKAALARARGEAL